MSTGTAAETVSHACVVQLGFSGSRNLFPGISDPVRRNKFTAELTDQIAFKLKYLHKHDKLGLHEGHFFVGIAQMAVGGDWVFADACDKAGITMRVFLPQTRDEFLTARSPRPPHGEDFTPDQRDQALQRLQRNSVIQERVVSDSADRSARFVEASAEILRVADIAVTLQPKDSAVTGRAGGTDEFAERAGQTGKLVYALTYWIDENQKLHVYENFVEPTETPYTPPQLPPEIGGPRIDRQNFLGRLKSYGSVEAKQYKKHFERASKFVIGAHVLATALAAGALAVSYTWKPAQADAWPMGAKVAIGLLLAFELVLLFIGYFSHRFLHRDHIVHRWSDVRLTAEIARSVQAFAGQHCYLAHLFALPLPESYRALTRTLNVLHLQATHDQRKTEWKEHRDRYMAERFTDPVRSQVVFYEGEEARARKAQKRVSVLFNVLTVAAALATVLKLSDTWLEFGLSSGHSATLGWLAITLPVLAVGALSLTAVLDKEARASVYQAMMEFLKRQQTLLQRATSEPEFLRLQKETEARLLGEILNWYYRRRFISPNQRG